MIRQILSSLNVALKWVCIASLWVLAAESAQVLINDDGSDPWVWTLMIIWWGIASVWVIWITFRPLVKLIVKHLKN